MDYETMLQYVRPAFWAYVIYQICKCREYILGDVVSLVIAIIFESLKVQRLRLRIKSHGKVMLCIVELRTASWIDV